MSNKNKQNFQGRTNPSQNPSRGTERTERTTTPVTPAQRQAPTRKS